MSDITADPVFQLNTVLWMLQPLAARPGAVNPVLYSAGYRVRSLGPKLSSSAELEAALAPLDLAIGVPDPDVLASAPAGEIHPAFECKASSFGTDSTTAKQARKLLARARDLALPLGAQPGVVVPGCVVYVTREAEAIELLPTLEALSAELADGGIDPAPASVLGISSEAGEGLMVGIAGGDLPGPAGAVLASPQVIVPPSEAMERAHPLYLVPYDPSVDQSPEEGTRCKRILLERIRMHTVNRIGRCDPPETVVIEGEAVLYDATFGLSKYWRQAKHRQAAAHLGLAFVKRSLQAIRPDPPDVVDLPGGSRRLEVTLVDVKHRDAVANALVAAPLPPELRELEDEQQSLNLWEQAASSGEGPAVEASS